MWSSWFSNGIFTKKGNKNANLQRRIVNLLEPSKTLEKDASPTLKELQSQRNKVKRMSSVYEENISAYNENTVISRKSFPDNVSAPKLTLSAKINSILSQQQKIPLDKYPAEWSKVQKGLKYILDLDNNYIKRMELMIEKYVNAFDDIPAIRLKGEESITERQKEEIFGPIVKIHELHKNEFHPILLACSGNVGFFARNVSEMCKNGSFSMYIIYAMDQKECEYRRSTHYTFFFMEIMDKVGFSFEFNAIQQLAQYHLVIIDMLKGLKDQEDASEETIEALTQAEADWKEMMNKIYNMRNLSTQ